MLDRKILDNFTEKANHSYQQFCVWMYTNNEFVKYQKIWNEILEPRKLFKTEEFSREKGCKYKNFWDVVISTLQQGWILGVIRLLDPPYFLRDTKKENPRLSLYYILDLLEDDELEKSIKEEMDRHKIFIDSIKKQRPTLAHNEIKIVDKRIEAGVENLFEALDNIITEIKNKKPHLKDCYNINREYMEKLSKCGVEEIFERL